MDNLNEMQAQQLEFHEFELPTVKQTKPPQESEMKPFYIIVLLALFMINMAFAGEADIRAGMAQRFPYAKIISVKKTPYSGLYEVAFDDQLVYTDEKMDYLFSGNILDLHTLKNLTEVREKQLYAINFDELPLNLAIKNVKGNGKRRLAVFTDPNCSYCKKLEKGMVNLTNTTIYILVYPILPGSEERSKTIWCAPDRLKAWEEHMLNGVEPQTGKICDTTALTKIAMQGRKLGINVTPTLVFEDGVIKPGIMTPELLDERLTEAMPK